MSGIDSLFAWCSISPVLMLSEKWIALSSTVRICTPAHFTETLTVAKWFKKRLKTKLVVIPAYFSCLLTVWFPATVSGVLGSYGVLWWLQEASRSPAVGQSKPVFFFCLRADWASLCKRERKAWLSPLMALVLFCYCTLWCAWVRYVTMNIFLLQKWNKLFFFLLHYFVSNLSLPKVKIKCLK